MDLGKTGINSGTVNNKVEFENNSGIRQARGYGLFEGIKNFFRNLHLPKIFSKSLSSRKVECLKKSDENLDPPSLKTIKNSNVNTDKNSDVDKNHIYKESEKRVKDFLDTDQYSENGPKTMNINGIQMQKIKVGDNVYVFPKAMYKKSGLSAEEATKRIDSGKQIYEKIKNSNFDSNGKIGFRLTNRFSKKAISNLVWFLEYKACRKNPNYSSNSSNMRVPDNDGKIYDAIRTAINMDKNDATGGVYGRGGKWMFGRIDESSHFNTKNAKKIKKSQVGLDFEFGKLPFGKRTILLAHGNPDGAENIEKGTYIKLEDVGINGGIADTLEHGLNYFKSKGKVISHDVDFREKLVCSKEAKKELSKYGKTVSEIYLKAEKGKIKDEELEKVKKLLVEEEILSEGEKLIDREDLKIRLGRELILKDEDLQ